MALTELVEEIEKQARAHRKEERHLLECITILSDYEIAKAAEERFKPEKHLYSFDGYLYQLKKVCELIKAGISKETVLEQADTCLPTEQIIENFKEGIVCHYQEN